MSEQELNIQERLLSQALKESYEKMLILKMKLGQKVVINDSNGKPLTISAEQAWDDYKKSQSSGLNNASNR